MKEKFALHVGCCIEVLRSLPENSVDSVVTDPPYGIRFMGKAWDGKDIEDRAEYGSGMPSQAPAAGAPGGHNSLAAEAGKYDLSPKAMTAFMQFSHEWATEALRVLKPGGHLLSFSSARTYHRMAVGIEMAGFEIRDQIMWLFGSGFPKSHNLKGEHEGWGTALKPAHEPICVARKPLIGTVATNVAEHGTGAINIDGCRIPSEPMPPNTGKGALPRRSVDEVREASEPTQPHGLGRWPANLIHDGSAEVVAIFPAKAGAAGPVKGTEPSHPTDNCYGEYGRVESQFYGDKGSAARFFYCAKASKKDRNEGLGHMPDAILARSCQAQADAKRGITVDEASGAFNKARITKNNHPTVKPTDLMAYLCRMVTPTGGTVLDPFTGSGSTGKAAVREGFNFIGIEIDPGSAEIADARIKYEIKSTENTTAQLELV